MALTTHYDPRDDFLADARNRMVNSQICPNRVTDPRILDAMRRLPREQFLPASQLALAYADQNVPLRRRAGAVATDGAGPSRAGRRTVTKREGPVVGAGTGYPPRCSPKTGCAVTALEESGALFDKARRAGGDRARRSSGHWTVAGGMAGPARPTT